MRKILPYLIIIMGATNFLAPSFSYGDSPQPIDFVIDLDRTLIFTVESSDIPAGYIPTHFQDGKGTSIVVEGAGEFIASLLEMPNARVSFFSASGPDRIRNVLKHIRLPGKQGKTALDIAHKILDSGDTIATSAEGKRELARMGFPEVDRIPVDPQVQPDDMDFQGWDTDLKKDLKKINPNIDNVYLIDDNKKVVVKGQEKNFIGVTSNEAVNTDMTEHLANPEKKPTRFELDIIKGETEEFFYRKNSLANTRGLIEAAIEKSQKEKMPLKDALWILQNDSEKSTGELLGYFRRGFRAFKIVNPEFHSAVPFPPNRSSNCTDMFRKKLIQLLLKHTY